ncbi:proprotein convertase subtilisin/kexin type 1 inhibitor, like isoform X2 [Dunckerocampus dactyliophorus]|uniref:proprotein convertase subtilisin/kexin type 1 inhibitor, like isoform X2 n=1 Tax=Dunckerocampus dactyliophorus TaxID=161453 RepID=UPI002404B50C|nr:proprotein convertase subtilisin/kexin type 1 inhibitor, like isoform X2 [Dunckerocampus dactyliophorus]
MLLYSHSSSPTTSMLCTGRARSVSRMASLILLLLLLAVTQCAPAGFGGHGLDLSAGGVRRQDILPYDGKGMFHPAWRRGGMVDEGWSGQSLEQALQWLVERDQRREQEEQRAAYARALLRLLAKAEAAGDMLMEEDKARGDFQGPPPADYETGWGISMGRYPAHWLTLVVPQLLQALMDRTETQVGRARHEILQRDLDEDEDRRRLLASILSIIGSDHASPGHRVQRRFSVKPLENVGSAYRRSRRSLDDAALPLPSNQPPLLRVKRRSYDN